MGRIVPVSMLLLGCALGYWGATFTRPEVGAGPSLRRGDGAGALVATSVHHAVMCMRTGSTTWATVNRQDGLADLEVPISLSGSASGPGPDHTCWGLVTPAVASVVVRRSPGGVVLATAEVVAGGFLFNARRSSGVLVVQALDARGAVLHQVEWTAP